MKNDTTIVDSLSSSQSLSPKHDPARWISMGVSGALERTSYVFSMKSNPIPDLQFGVGELNVVVGKYDKDTSSWLFSVVWRVTFDKKEDALLYFDRLRAIFTPVSTGIREEGEDALILKGIEFSDNASTGFRRIDFSIMKPDNGKGTFTLLGTFPELRYKR